VTPTAQNLIRVFFLREQMKKTAGSGNTIKYVHVIGAGAMGGDIAAWCAHQDMRVTLADMKPEPIAGAIKRAADLYGKIIHKRTEQRDTLDRLIPDMDGEGVRNADLIIEAVPEKLELKQKVYAGLEPKMKAGAILATNTSSIPLQDLRTTLQRPERLVGLHFFNPVSRLQLVEVVSHDGSDQQILKAALAFVGAIDRLPLPVKSSPGFLVNRALTPYMLEAMVMLDENIDKVAIDAAAKKFGMPMGPIELADQVGLDICLDVGDMLRSKFGDSLPPTPAAQLQPESGNDRSTGAANVERLCRVPARRYRRQRGRGRRRHDLRHGLCTVSRRPAELCQSPRPGKCGVGAARAGSQIRRPVHAGSRLG
jgi:3-hydroxyacyl-CoA dehydrogenase/enoyl-CoA hydratase/3-hydroxybutyryl-CoA epimerase